MRPRRAEEVGHNPHDVGQSSVFISSVRSSFEHPQNCHMSFQDSPIKRLISSRWISLMRLTAANFARACD